MTYSTSDAVAVWQELQANIRDHGHDEAFLRASAIDPELLALTLTLCVSATS